VFSTQVIHHAFKKQVQLVVKDIYRVLAPGGIAFVTVSGKLDEGVDFEEVEAGTYVPLSGDEAGLPHHIFSPETAAETFQAFKVEEVSVRAEGHVIAVWGRKSN
jgi:SAM-dependent methyltransferase